jgi:hypothetical protein
MKMITTTALQAEIKKLLDFIVEQYAEKHGVELVEVPRPKKLLDTTGGNTKIKKSSKGTAYRYASLSLRPNKILCPNAERAGCLEGCLNTAGRGAFNATQYARALKSYWYMTDPESFIAQLNKELTNFERACSKAGQVPAVRLNTISDINWRKVKQQHPGIEFIDYTKVAARLVKQLPNERLIFSYSGAQEYKRNLDLALVLDRPLAVVFRNGLPSTFLGRTVIDGDLSDIDNSQAGQVVVGLRAKGKAKQDTGSFTVDTIALANL